MNVWPVSYKEQLMTQTLKVLILICNYLMRRHKEPGCAQRYTGVRQKATDKFKYEKLRSTEEKFSLEGG